MRERARRSLRASPSGISQANKALQNFESKIALAFHLEVSRATIQKFFAGQPIGRENFHKICQHLELPWQAIAEFSEEFFQHDSFSDRDFNIDALVQEIRHKGRAYIQSKCGMMRVLDMSQPISLDGIYTNVNILETISSQQRLDITDLLKVCATDEFQRPNLGRIVREQLLGVVAVRKYDRLMILGKPGAGKTTFLKYIAIKCNSGQMQADRVPIFIPLKDFADFKQVSLLEYIQEQFSSWGVIDTDVSKKLLTAGKGLLLLDGLDEVKERDSQRILDSCKSFFRQFPTNKFIITCRIATKNYIFENFTEVEIADFDRDAINSFVTKWFATKDPVKSRNLIGKLATNQSILELAASPLLLTLMCLVFEELADFPSNRSELYQEGVEILLKKWDAKRNIEREQIYKQLSLQQKANLLGQIALTTFEQGEYFFRQETIENNIADYICHLPSVVAENSSLQHDSSAVLKAIEAQHGLLVERAQGIYSFSHLTFQEYFAAREIVASSNPHAFDAALKKLVSHIVEPRWREVFLLVVGMLRNADYMLQLMKQKIDSLLATDDRLQAFLVWVNQKHRTVSVSYKPAVVRAFYFDLAIAQTLTLVGSTLDLTRALDRDFTRSLEPSLALDLALDRTLALDRVVARSPNPHSVFENVLDRVIEHAQVDESELAGELKHLKQQLSAFSSDKKQFKQWWKINGQAWMEQIRGVAIAKRNLGHNWHFSKQQRDALKQYHYANQLLVECLNSNYYITRTMRSQIENTLLLPIAQIN